MIKLVLTDLDDTLIPFGNPGVSDFARAAIHELLDAGVHFGPVSGRPPKSMGWMFGNDPACFATGAFANGQVIYVDGELRRAIEISRDDLDQAVRAIDELDGVFIAHLDLDEPDNSAFLTYRSDKAAQIPDDFPFAHKVRLGIGEGPYLKVAMCFSRKDQAYVTEVRDYLNGAVPGLDFYRPSNVVPALDVSPRGWTKGSAVLAVAEELGISPDEVCVFGDTENDVPMLAAVPYSVAVGNANEDAKAAARFHIGDCRQESVAKALLAIAAASRRGELPAFLR